MLLANAGVIFQNAYLVENLEAAATHWAQNCGVGPFAAYKNQQYKSVIYRGQETSVDVSLAFAYCGDFQIELIQVHDIETPSVFTDALKTQGFGLHHIGILCETFDETIAAFTEKAMPVLQRGVDVNDVETVFMDSAAHPGAMVELLRATPALSESLDFLKLVSADWDGNDSIMYL